MYTVGIITISDKGAAGQREDKSGPKIRQMLPKDEYEVVSYKIIPDERKQIADELVRLSDDMKCNLVLTTGGTGFAPRDITPEATMDVAQRNAIISNHSGSNLPNLGCKFIRKKGYIKEIRKK